MQDGSARPGGRWCLSWGAHACMCAQVLNYVAGGRDVAASVAFVCSSLLRGPGAPLVKRLAYDIVQVTLGSSCRDTQASHEQAPWVLLLGPGESFACQLWPQMGSVTCSPTASMRPLC